MSKKTRKDAAAEIRKLREENALLKREVSAHCFDSAGAREGKEKLLGRIATLESKVAKYKNLFDQSTALYKKAFKDAAKGFVLAEKYFDKAKRWRFSFFAVLAGVILFCVTKPFLNY